MPEIVPTRPVNSPAIAPPTTVSPAPKMPPAPPGAPASPGAPADAAAGAEKTKGPGEGALLAQVKAREAKLIRDRQAFAREQEQLARTKTEIERIQNSMLSGLGPEKPKGPPTADDKVAALEAQLAELREWRDTQAKSAADAQAQTTLDAEMARFSSEALASRELRPLAATLAEKDPGRFRKLTLQFAREDGTLTNEEYLDRIEEELGHYTSLRSPAATQSSAAPDPAASPGTAPSGSRTAPTLTAATASERASDPGSMTHLSLKERNDRSIAAARAAREERAKRAAQTQ